MKRKSPTLWHILNQNTGTYWGYSKSWKIPINCMSSSTAWWKLEHFLIYIIFSIYSWNLGEYLIFCFIRSSSFRICYIWVFIRTVGLQYPNLYMYICLQFGHSNFFSWEHYPLIRDHRCNNNTVIVLYSGKEQIACCNINTTSSSSCKWLKQQTLINHNRNE